MLTNQSWFCIIADELTTQTRAKCFSDSNSRFKENKPQMREWEIVHEFGICSKTISGTCWMLQEFSTHTHAVSRTQSLQNTHAYTQWNVSHAQFAVHTHIHTLYRLNAEFTIHNQAYAHTHTEFAEHTCIRTQCNVSQAQFAACTRIHTLYRLVCMHLHTHTHTQF